MKILKNNIGKQTMKANDRRQHEGGKVSNEKVI